MGNAAVPGQFQGVIIALETATPAGSVALLRGGKIIASRRGSSDRAHGERLPGEIIKILCMNGLALKDVERYAVAIGPGSFTGLRVGVATVQGLALARSVPIVGVSTLAAIAESRRDAEAQVIAVWLDGLRRQVFGAAFLRLSDVNVMAGERPSNVMAKAVMAPSGFAELEPHCVGTPTEVAGKWLESLSGRSLVLVGDGGVRFAKEAEARLGRRVLTLPMPEAIAPALGQLASMANGERLVGPHAIRPMYIRRPAVELARDQRRNMAEPSNSGDG